MAVSDRFTFVSLSLIGRSVDVELVSGEVYEGVLHTLNLEEGLGVVLRMARKTRDPKDSAPQRVYIDELVFPGRHVAQVNAKGVSNVAGRQGGTFAGFSDTEISRAGGGDGNKKNLVAWVPDSAPSASDMTLGGKEDIGWDQFAVNKAKFGVESTYDENLYTTRLDTSSMSAQQWAAAAAMAGSIEALPSDNLHVREERGAVSEGGREDDEEARYSAVLGSGGYQDSMPAAVKAHLQTRAKPATATTKLTASAAKAAVFVPGGGAHTLAPTAPAAAPAAAYGQQAQQQAMLQQSVMYQQMGMMAAQGGDPSQYGGYNAGAAYGGAAAYGGGYNAGAAYGMPPQQGYAPQQGGYAGYQPPRQRPGAGGYQPPAGK